MDLALILLGTSTEEVQEVSLLIGVFHVPKVIGGVFTAERVPELAQMGVEEG